MTSTFNFTTNQRHLGRPDPIRVRWRNGVTKMVSISSFESKDMRDGMIQSGMETGWWRAMNGSMACWRNERSLSS